MGATRIFVAIRLITDDQIGDQPAESEALSVDSSLMVAPEFESGRTEIAGIGDLGIAKNRCVGVLNEEH